MSKVTVFRFGQNAFIAYLAFLSAFVPLSTDLYLPALPGMTRQLASTPDLVNLTLSCFMFLFALSMLVWGPFSDKYGRKPILTIGLVLYILASIGCALSENIWQLIAGRCLQAIGSGSLGAVTMAVVKDTFRGRTMENVLTAIQTMSILAPMVAPVLGGFLLTFTSWRGIFWLLALSGALALLVGLALGETLRSPTKGPALRVLLRIGYVLKNKGFRALLIVFSLSVMPFMAYLAISAYIFQNTFSQSAQAYSAFFAANAAFSMLGPVLYVRLFRNFSRRFFLAACFAVTAAAGALLLAVGSQGPFVFAALYGAITFFHSSMRPPSTMLLMCQLDTDNGTVASLVGASGLLCGALSMFLCSLPVWPDFITAAGIISLGLGAFCTAGWLYLDSRRTFRG